MISTAPRLAEMNARPVTHAGSERPERKKSIESETDRRAINADAEHEHEVDRDEQVVDGIGVEAQRTAGGDGEHGDSSVTVRSRWCETVQDVTDVRVIPPTSLRPI